MPPALRTQDRIRRECSFIRCFRASKKSHQGSNAMNFVANLLIKMGILKQDLDYRLLRTSMVILFAFFGYKKWFNNEGKVLTRYKSHAPLIFWLYPIFGLKGATWF